MQNNEWLGLSYVFFPKSTGVTKLFQKEDDMEVNNIFDLDFMQFPTRKTRVMIGENGRIHGQHFCQGYVVIAPGGTIPEHNHETIETYTIIEGHGLMTIDDESQEMKKGDFVYIQSNQKHTLTNIGTSDLHMMFVYAPSVVVSHWAEEEAGLLK
jgi:quercetin dioxygenase-like cupin family protein